MRWILVAPLLFVLACHKQAPPPSVTPTATVKTEDRDQALKDAMGELKTNFQRIHFDYDSSTLNDSSKATLTTNAAILQRFPEIKIEIQGHADERGTTEYNLALGEQRATSVRKYLGMQGVAESRMPTVSFGEEKPLENGHTESVYAENRRVEFRLLIASPVDGVNGTTP